MSGKFSRRASIREMHADFNIPYVYGFSEIICKYQAVIQNYDIANVPNKYKAKPQTESIRGLNVVAVRRSSN